jgi:hypothetical protein
VQTGNDRLEPDIPRPHEFHKMVLTNYTGTVKFFNLNGPGDSILRENGK